MNPAASALCPACEAPGVLGQPCRERVCARQALHFIPAAEAKLALGTAATQREPLIGQFIGDFLVVGRLGKGGFGKVLLGLQRPLYRLKAAIKLLEVHQQNVAVAKRVLQKFENEAAALAVLQHPNIVRLLQYGSFQDQPFLVMEFIGGRTLQNEINRAALQRTGLEPDVVLHVLTQLLNALEAAHEQDIIHRDIKPENVMLQAVVGDPWHVKVVDFGLAKVIAESNETSVALGTVVYMAPEQIEAKNLGPWTDLYAVTAVAFELITGQRAFAGGDTQNVIRQKLAPFYDPFARLPDLGLHAGMVEFLRKGLARYPDARFRSTTEMRDALVSAFDLGSATRELSRDLSGLLDSEEVARVRRDEARLEAERKALEAEWRALDVERQRLDSEKVRLDSERVRSGGGSALIPAREVEVSSTLKMPPIPSSPAEREARLAAKRRNSAEVPMGTRAIPPLDFAPVLSSHVLAPAAPPEPARGRTWMWLSGAAFVAVGVAVAIVVSGGSGEEASATRKAAVEAASIAASVSPPSGEPVGAGAATTPEVTNMPPSTDPGTITKVEVANPPAPANLAVQDAGPTVAAEVAPVVEVAPAVEQVALAIDSKPGGAAVFIDGKPFGATPISLPTRVGARHRLELRLTGRTTESREIVVTKGQAPVIIALQPPRVVTTTSQDKPRPKVDESSKEDEKPKLTPMFME